jgi:hypothetical protein
LPPCSGGLTTDYAVYPIAIVDGRAVYDSTIFEADDEEEIVEALNVSAGNVG